jgi:hypothetical protein
METTGQFPVVEPNDFGTVAVALETANVLYHRGESAEALRWLRRAAESAEKEGDDLRALSLARAAADLREQLNVPPSVRPGAKLPSPPPSPATRTGAVGVPQSSAPPVRSQPPPLPTAEPSSTRSPASLPSKPPIAPSSKPPIASKTSLPSKPPTASKTPVPSKPPSAAPTASKTPAPTKTPIPSKPPARLHAVSAASNGAKKDISVEPEELGRTAVRAEDKQAPSSDQRVALRVAIESASQAEGTLVVRILGEGDQAGPGAVEALLVPLRPGIDVTQLSLPPPVARARH